MKNWDLPGLDVVAHQPQVLSTTPDGRSIVLNLPAGEQLQEHEVHERAYVMVVSGEVEVSTPGGESVTGGAGTLLEFDPQERHTVDARSDALLLLILTPWPGEGHPSN